MIIALLATLVFVVAVSVLAIQIRNRRFFTLLTFATVLFVIEGVGAALMTLPALSPHNYPPTWDDSRLNYMTIAFVLYIASFLLFLSGYVCVSLFRSPRKLSRTAVADVFFDRFWTPAYQVMLMVLTFAMIAIGFVQHYQRIRVAGGLSDFLATAYKYRFGTAAETVQESALLGLTNLVSSSAVALVVLFVIAWGRGRLTLWSKLFVVAIVFLLLFRQWTTMFRASFFFTILALIAAYESERRVSMRRVVIVGLTLFGILIATNFVHFYLYSLTAGWDRRSFIQSQTFLLAPHAHVQTLAAILAQDARGLPHLKGSGFVESIFFFVPRLIWESKAASGSYGTMLVQSWADLPTHFQAAVTAAGELIAHFGYVGITLMILYGALYAMLDRFRDGTPVLRAALFGMLLPRVLSDMGMGVSALAITLVSLAIFLGVIYVGELACRALGGFSRRGQARHLAVHEAGMSSAR